MKNCRIKSSIPSNLLDKMDQVPPQPTLTPAPPVSPVIPAPKTPMFPILFTILFLAVFSVVGYFGYKNLPAVKVDRLIKDCLSRGGALGESYPPQCFTPTPTPTQFADPTTNWKIYSNEDLGIMFKHPTELKEDTTGSSGINGISLEDSNYRIVILSGMNKGGAREESEKFINDIAAEGKKITVGGQPGSLSSLSYQGSKIITAYIISNRNDSLYSVSIQTKTTSISTDVENIFDQILSTFKFTGTSVTPTLTPTPTITPTPKPKTTYTVPVSWKRLTTQSGVNLCLPPKWEVEAYDHLIFNRDEGYRPSITYITNLPYSGGSRREAYFAYWANEYPEVKQLVSVTDTDINGNSALTIYPANSSDPKTSPEGLTVVWYSAGKLWKAGLSGWNMTNASQASFLKDFYTMISCSL